MNFPYIADRKKRLAQFNKILKERGLKPIIKLGDARIKGETELLKILAIHGHYGKYGADVEFETKDWLKRTGHWVMHWTGNSLESDGNIYVVMVNDKYLLSKQHRPVLGKWKKGLPRGYELPLPKRSVKKKVFQEIQISDIPMQTLLRELGENVVRSLDVAEVAFLGQIATNDGKDTATPNYWLIKVDIPKKVLDKRMKEITDEGVKIVLMSQSEVEADIGKADGISDALSITGIHLAEKYIREHK